MNKLEKLIGDNIPTVTGKLIINDEYIKQNIEPEIKINTHWYINNIIVTSSVAEKLKQFNMGNKSEKI